MNICKPMSGSQVVFLRLLLTAPAPLILALPKLHGSPPQKGELL